RWWQRCLHPGRRAAGGRVGHGSVGPAGVALRFARCFRCLEFAMNDRRRFLKAGLASAAALAVPAGVAAGARGGEQAAAGANAGDALRPAARPRIVSTWDFGVGANQAAWMALQAGGSALDAVEAGARWAEADLCNASVGHCGNPDRDGVLTLDASIMDGDGRCGAVAAIEDILHPVSGARAVMEKTPHVLLAGDGAQQ